MRYCLCLRETPRSPRLSSSLLQFWSLCIQRKCLHLISRTHRPHVQLLVLWRCAWTNISNWTKNINEEVGSLQPMRLDSQLKVELHILLWRSQPNYTAGSNHPAIQAVTNVCSTLSLQVTDLLLFSLNVFLYLYCWSVMSERENLTSRFIGGKLKSRWTVTHRNALSYLSTYSSHCLFWYSTFSCTIKMSFANFSRRHAWALSVSYFPTEPILHLKSLVRHCGLCWLRLWGLCAVTQTEHRAGFILMLLGFYTRNTRVPEWSAPMVRCFLFWLW